MIKRSALTTDLAFGNGFSYSREIEYLKVISQMTDPVRLLLFQITFPPLLLLFLHVVTVNAGDKGKEDNIIVLGGGGHGGHGGGHGGGMPLILICK